MEMYTYVCIYIYIRIYIDKQTTIYIYIYVYMYICAVVEVDFSKMTCTLLGARPRELRREEKEKDAGWLGRFMREEEFDAPVEVLTSASLMDRVQPNWMIELQDKWRSYSLEESMAIECYWKVFSQRPSGACLARVMLKNGVADVDFSHMTCTLQGSPPKKIKREEKDAGWLSNEFFWEAFQDLCIYIYIYTYIY